MKRIIATVVLAMALLTSSAVVMQPGIVGMAYADNDGGSE
jgi:hypothetical protein